MMFRFLESHVIKGVVFATLLLTFPVVYTIDVLPVWGSARTVLVTLYMMILAVLPTVLHKGGWVGKEFISKKMYIYQSPEGRKLALRQSGRKGAFCALLLLICAALWTPLTENFGLIAIQLPLLAAAYYVAELSFIELYNKLQLEPRSP